jgi:DNA-binding GntR family transcriptional regulator
MTPQIGQLDSKSLTDQAHRALRELVLAGQFHPGQRLNESELAASLGISRGPIREAIQRLASEGLATMVPRRGAFIPEFTAERLKQLYEVREVIETAAARLAAQRRSEADIAMLRGIVTETARILESDTSVAYPMELDPHQALLAITRNPYLVSTAADIQTKIQLARSISASRPPRARAAFTEHSAIVSAVIDGDPDQAEHAMRAHLAASFDSVGPLVTPLHRVHD